MPTSQAGAARLGRIASGAKSINLQLGFTLIELVIVLVVIAFVSALAYAPITRGLDGLRLQTSARDIVAALKHARERAISEQKVFVVGFDVEKHQVYLADEFGEQKRFVQLKSNIRLRQVRIDGVAVGHETNMVGEVLFFPNGSGSVCEIILENRGGSRLKIRSDFPAGTFKVENVSRSEPI